MRYLFWCFCTFYTTFSIAQTLDSIELSTIEVSALRYIPNKNQIDSTQIHFLPTASLSELLHQHTSVYIKSYGANGISTTSIRGGSASHTLVLWNGLPIQNPMLGQVDLSVFPSHLFDEVRLDLGGNSAIWGSAAVGGVIHLNTQQQLGKSIQARSTIGSFGLMAHQFKVQFGNPTFQTTIKIWQQQAENNFPYTIIGVEEKKKQTHANLQQWGILQENTWQIAPKWRINWNNWYQTSDRQIPPTTTQRQSIATQLDESFRTNLNAKYALNNTVLQARAALFFDRLNFFDVAVDSKSRTWSNIYEIEGKSYISQRHTLTYGTNWTILKAATNGYVEPITSQNRLAFFTGYQYQHEQWKTHLAIRQELVDGSLVPITPSLQVDYQLLRTLYLQGLIARNYRIPTFNDLYWAVGGNPDLLPELGWSEEISLQWKPKLWDARLTFFNRNLNNRILWQPQPDRGFWSPENVDQVWSRGLEMRWNFQQITKHYTLKWTLGYDYVRSTVKESKDAVLVGKQLIYTPEHQGFTSIFLKWKSLAFQYNHTYTDRVLLQVRNPRYLESYQLGFASLSYDWQIQKVKGNIIAKINNCWDTDYRVIDRRPMPGRNYECSFLIQI